MINIIFDILFCLRFAQTGVLCLPPGTVGVAAVTAGPGLTNTVTAVKNAQMAESPLLLLGGAAGTLLQVNPTAGNVRKVCFWRLTSSGMIVLWSRAGEHCRTLTRCPSSSRCASSVPLSGRWGRSCPLWGKLWRPLSQELPVLFSSRCPLTRSIPSIWSPKSLEWRTHQKAWLEKLSHGTLSTIKVLFGLLSRLCNG